MEKSNEINEFEGLDLPPITLPAPPQIPCRDAWGEIAEWYETASEIDAIVGEHLAEDYTWDFRPIGK